MLARHRLPAALASRWQDQKWFASWERKVRAKKWYQAFGDSGTGIKVKEKILSYSEGEKKNQQQQQKENPNEQ